MNILPVVHCVDTEGPLNETERDTWKRVKDLIGGEYKVNFIEKILSGDLDKHQNIEKIKSIINKRTMNYIRDLNEHHKMLDVIFSDQFRKKFNDDFGSSYKFSWFIVDHIDYDSDDRDKFMGRHAIYDLFDKRNSQLEHFGDSLEFHFHSNPPSRHSSHSNTFWLRDEKIHRVVLGRLIDRNFFPIVNRPGFHSVSPDSHWFQESFIPFEFANQSLARLAPDRWSDWSRAPKTWVPYHPSHDDYQAPGQCRRRIGTCLNIGTRHSEISEEHIEFAFEELLEDKNVVLSVNNHDFRDMRYDTEWLHNSLTKISKKYKQVKFMYCNARQALNFCIKPNQVHKFMFSWKNSGRVTTLNLESPRDIFGPQPFFGYKSNDGRYIYDNMQIKVPFRKWAYVFDEQSMPLHLIETVAFAANYTDGNQSQEVIRVSNMN